MLPRQDEHILTISSWKALLNYTATVGSKQSVNTLSEQIEDVKEVLNTSLYIEHGETKLELANLMNRRSHILRLNSIAELIAKNKEKHVFIPGSTAAMGIGMYALISNDDWGPIVRAGTFIYGTEQEEANDLSFTWTTISSPLSMKAYKESRYRAFEAWAPLLSVPS